MPHSQFRLLSSCSGHLSTVPCQRVLNCQQRRILPSVPRRASIHLFSHTSEKAEESQESENPPFPAAQSEPQDLVRHDGIDKILQEAHPERVLCSLLYTPEGKSFIKRTDRDRFSSALASIDLRYIISPIAEVYTNMNPTLTEMPVYRWVRDIGERVDTVAEEIANIIDLRLDAGHLLTQQDCRHLLDCARVLTQGPMARQVWQLMQSEFAEPGRMDVFMFNCYLEAICWSNTLSKTEQWRLRVTPRILELRSRFKRPKDLSGHKVGFRGLRQEALECFRRMAQDNLDGDEATFTSLMIAMGREGDLAGAKSILKSVYNIDVDLLLQVDEEELESPTFYEVDSPLRPTSLLLHTLVHVFASNNEIRLAFKLLDYASRYYDLQIPFQIWSDLFNWATVLSKSRTGVEQEQGQAIGHISARFFDELWTQMTDQPHNVEPDVAMYMNYTRSFHYRVLYHEALAPFQSGLLLFQKRRGEAQKMGRRFVELNRQILDSPNTSAVTVLPAQWFNMRRDFIMASLIEDQELQLIIVTGRKLLTQQAWTPEIGFHKGWNRRFLPDLIEKYTEYLPNSITYKVAGGQMEMRGLKGHRVNAASADMHMTAWNGLLRSHMEGPMDIGGLREAWQEVEPKLSQWDDQCQSTS